MTFALVVLAALAVTAMVLYGGSVAVAWFSTHPPRLKSTRTPASFGAEFEDIRFFAADGTALSGWWVPAAAPRGCLILCHGMAAHREQLLPWAPWLWEAGFSLLLFDFRAMGASEGDLCTMGLQEMEDVIGAVDYVKSREPGLPMGGVGFSMGGVALMLAAARDERIGAITTLGSYTCLDSAITQRCRRHFGPFGPVVEKPARKLGAKWFPGDPMHVDCVEAVKQLGDRPALFVNGMKDPVVLPRNARDLYDAASGPKDVFLLPLTAHAYPVPGERAEYEQAVKAFFAGALTSPKALRDSSAASSLSDR